MGLQASPGASQDLSVQEGKQEDHLPGLLWVLHEFILGKDAGKCLAHSKSSICVW